jgi:hypothetical protein
MNSDKYSKLFDDLGIMKLFKRRTTDDLQQLTVIRMENINNLCKALIQHNFVFDKNVTEDDVIQFVKQKQKQK